MSGAVLTGVVGQIRWSYFNAAAINGYTVTRTGKGPTAVWRLSAKVVMSDAFKLTQRPLMFEAPHSHGSWRWPIQSMEITEGTLTATLGPLEEQGKL